MSQEILITLPITEVGIPSQYQFYIKVNGKLLINNQILSPVDTKAVKEISHQFSELFESRLGLSIEAQISLGRDLFKLWLAAHWDKIKQNVPTGSRRILVIASKIPEILNLPWEMLYLPEGGFVSTNPLFSIRRLPRADELAKFNGDLRPRPLRLLFMACAPTDQPPLDYELEEEYLLDAVSGAEVAFDSGDLGTFEDLCERVESFQPHIVHLTGHGIVQDGEGWFCFENEVGLTDPRSSKEISSKLAGSSVQCVFISGCQSGKSPPVEAIGGICQGLVINEVPLAIGWAASIADDLATQFARTFYGTLAARQPIDRALVMARQAVWERCKDQNNLSWTLPMLYSFTSQDLVVDPNPQRLVEEPIRTTVIQQPLPGMKEGYAEHFVGRRREQQRLTPALRDGKKQVLIITGLGGSGKSTLATRIARKLETEGFMLIPVPSSEYDPLNSGRLLAACVDAFQKIADDHEAKGEQVKANRLKAACQRLDDPAKPAMARLRQVVDILNSDKFLLVLDNFESNLKEQDRKIIDPELAEFYKYLIKNLAGKSRAIITTRYPPSDMLSLPGDVQVEDLGDFKEPEFIKILRRDDQVDQRYRSGDLPLSLLRRLYEKFGGTPRFLLQMREAIKEMASSELKSELDQVELPYDTEPHRLEALRNDYFETIFTSRLYSYLDLEARKALSKSAVYGIAVNVEGLSVVTGLPRDTLSRSIRSWQDRAFIYTGKKEAGSDLWAVYGLTRVWLLNQLDPTERKQAYKAAGDFLKELERQNQVKQLGLSWMDVLQEARSQYLQAGEFDQARGLTDRISGYLIGRGLYEGVRQINLEMLRYGDHPLPMIWIGRAYLDRWDYKAAKDWYQQALKASKENTKEASIALHGLATIYMNQGKYLEAQEKFKEALNIQQKNGDRVGEAATWHNLAHVDMNLGKYLEAQEKFKEALKITQEIGDRMGNAGAWHGLAIIDMNQGKYPEAQKNFKEALKTRQEIGDRAGEAATWHNLATIDLRQGKYPEAQEMFMEALKIQQKIGDRAGEAATWNNLATIDMNQGKYLEAQKKLMRVLKITQEIGDRVGEARIWHQFGFLAAIQEKKEEGAKLVALCYLLDKSIGHGYTENDFRTLSGMASELRYSQEQFDSMLREVIQSYQRDQGQSLLDAAFR